MLEDFEVPLGAFVVLYSSVLLGGWGGGGQGASVVGGCRLSSGCRLAQSSQ